MSLLDRVRVLAAKIETTKGTAIALAAADGVFNVENAVILPDIPMIKRPSQGSMSQLSAVPAGRKGRCTFKLPLCGSGSSGAPTPAWATTFLPACGMKATSNAFAPVSSFADYKTLTIGLWIDGLFLSLAGAMGTFTIEGTHGEPAVINFDFQGVWQAPTDVANIAPTYPTVIPPRFAAATLAFGAYAPDISKLTLAANNEIYVVPSTSTAAAYKHAVVTDRGWAGQLDPELALVATHDAFGTWLAGTEAALNLVIGATAGNIVTVGAPKCQYVNVQPGERNKLSIANLDFQCNKSAAAGNDEVSITFS